jgi:uncharacterized membrane protein YcaP (DUF421 family)
MTSEVAAALRQDGHADLNFIDRIVLETEGSLSVVPKGDEG